MMHGGRHLRSGLFRMPTGIPGMPGIIPAPTVAPIAAFDPTWSTPAGQTGSTTRRGMGHGGRGIAEGDVSYVFGGVGATKCQTLESYDESLNSWTGLTNPSQQQAQCAQCIIDRSGTKYLYTFGGANSTNTATTAGVYRYNIALDSWAFVVNMPASRSVHAMAFDTVRGDTYILGGSTGSGTPSWESNVWRMDDTDTFDNTSPITGAALPALPVATRYAGAGIWGDNLFLIGGQIQSGNAMRSEVYKCDLSAGTLTWTATTHLPVDIGGFGSFQHGQYVYIVGGYINSFAGLTNRIFRYDLDNETVAELNTLGTTVGGPSLGVNTNDNTFYACMGWNGTADTGDCQVGAT